MLHELLQLIPAQNEFAFTVTNFSKIAHRKHSRRARNFAHTHTPLN